ncbi:hypothetical protein GW746_02030 [Candidatus Saccharibacteria bacterium]|nr:hypothetical protein [Candidatus Saccharibacteria bacterium]
MTKRGARSLDVEKYRCRWMEIEGKLSRDDASSYSLCILHADSLLDKALKERGVSGKTMGERMKQHQGKWTNGNGVWAAHKLRNRIAHEPEAVQLDYDRTRHALVAFKQGLKDVGAI